MTTSTSLPLSLEFFPPKTPEGAARLAVVRQELYTLNPQFCSGRFHTDWLNMMYPRLRLSRNLLRDDGAIFISCDDGEVANLREALDEIYGEECFVAQCVWKARKFTDARATTNVSTDHEYILAYAKSPEFSLRGVELDESKFANPDNDPVGPWMSRSMLGLATKDQRPNLHYVLDEPGTGRTFPPDPSTGWRYSQDRMWELVSEGRVLFPKKDDGRPREKKFRSEMQAEFVAFGQAVSLMCVDNATVYLLLISIITAPSAWLPTSGDR